jgi:hypothetical protein
MRFALLGSHPDGLEMAAALIASGRHSLLYHAAARPHFPAGVRPASDLEEVLADPAVEMVLVASGPAQRPAHLRRALQSERHVLCVHPADHTPEVAYEAGMLQQDTRQLLLPLLPDAFHPGVVRLRDFLPRPPAPPARPAGPHNGVAPPAAPPSPLGTFRVLEVEHWSMGELLLGTEVAGQKPGLPGWGVLRALGGEVAELSALAPGEEFEAGVPLLLAGRFERGGLFRATLLPRQAEGRLRLRVVGSAGEAELLFPLGVPGPAFLNWRGPDGETCEEAWDAWDPWPTMVEVFEEALAVWSSPQRKQGAPRLAWQDEVRALELDDAARRSAQRRRSSLLDYPEASEEVSFKGTMTLVGCGLLWGIILLAIASRWVPWIGWAVIPLLAVFLILQTLRWIIPPRGGQGGKAE